MERPPDNAYPTSMSWLLEHHRDHAAAQLRAHARDLGCDLGWRVVDAAKTEAREVRRQIGREVDLARREAASQLADDQPAKAASPLRLEDADRAELVDAAVGLDPPEGDQPPALARDDELLGRQILVVQPEAAHALGDRRQVGGPGRLEADVPDHCARRAPRARRAPMVPLQGLTHVGIGVSDMERSLHFYRDCLGFRHEHELRVAGEPSDTLLRLRGVDLHAVYLARDGVRIELLAFASPPPPPPRPRAMNQHGLTHLSFRVADLDATLAALRAAGERVLDETVIRFPAYQSAACFIVDPDGQLIELVQAPGDPAAPPRAG